MPTHFAAALVALAAAFSRFQLRLPPRLSHRHHTNPACLACLLACLPPRCPTPCPSRPCSRRSGLAEASSLRRPASCLACRFACLLLRLPPLASQHPHCLAAVLACRCAGCCACRRLPRRTCRRACLAALASQHLPRGLSCRACHRACHSALASQCVSPRLPLCACLASLRAVLSCLLPRFSRLHSRACVDTGCAYCHVGCACITCPVIAARAGSTFNNGCWPALSLAS